MFRGYERPICTRTDHLLTSSQALGRLTPREKYDRAYRLKRASQASMQHAPLSKELWLKPEEVPSTNIRDLVHI